MKTTKCMVLCILVFTWIESIYVMGRDISPLSKTSWDAGSELCKLHLRGKNVCFFPDIIGMEKLETVVAFCTVIGFFIFLFRCIPDSLFPNSNFCWSAAVSFGVFPWSVHIYRRPWSVEACSNVQRYSINLYFFLFFCVADVTQSGRAWTFLHLHCDWDCHILQQFLILWGVTGNFETN